MYTPQQLGLILVGSSYAIQKNDFLMLSTGQLVQVPLELIGQIVGDRKVFRKP